MNEQAGGIPFIKLLGVKVHSLDMETALETIRGYIGSGKPHIIVTADASSIVRALKDEDFLSIVNAADLVTADGAGIVQGAKLLGTPLAGRVSGVDVSRNLCKMAAEEGFSVYLLGAAPGVAEEAAANLKNEFPGLNIAGTWHGYFKPEEDAQIVEAIRRSGAKALLVALGIPRQEKWIRDHLSELGVCAAIGVGGSLDVFSGRVKRAPAWMQRHGLEWAYRLAKDPKKISKVSRAAEVRDACFEGEGIREEVGA